MYSYDSMLKKLEEKGYKRSDLTEELGLSSRTVAKIGKGEKLSYTTIKKIASMMCCEPEELYRAVSKNNVLQVLRDEKDNGISGGLYHELQVRMTYNSNHIEGSMLDEEQTRMIFETSTVALAGSVKVDDILETVHHFRAIDYVIDMAEETLSEEMIKHLHYMLKHDTVDSRITWFAVGDYKKTPNTVGGRETTPPEKVSAEMRKLLERYNSLSQVTIYDIIAFHADFERIHPFQDGNGRVGRLICLKECLHHDVVPFIIEDSKKLYYHRGLAQRNRENGYLIDTCLDGQDTFYDMLNKFGIKVSNS